MLGAQAIALGDADIVVAGGMESMSNVPYYLPGARAATAWATRRSIDGDDPRRAVGRLQQLPHGQLRPSCAPSEKKIDRAAQDAYAAESYRRALARAVAEGKFTRRDRRRSRCRSKKGAPQIVAEDEEPGRGDIEKLPTLRPAFQKDGTVTAGNASSHQRRRGGAGADGGGRAPRRAGWKPLARIRATRSTRRRPSGSPPRRPPPSRRAAAAKLG